MKLHKLLLPAIVVTLILISAGIFYMHNPRPLDLLSLTRNEAYRPQFHFTPPEKWMNDPNGMVYYEGEYHLFYQYHPDSMVWGPMHWGHAISTDLVNWQHLPIALAPDELGYIYSGSAVIDWENTAGFGKEAMIAAYTYHDPATSKQSQAIAYSTDKGRTWTKHEGNPVIPTLPILPNFRDPKVMWFDMGDGAGHWVMSVAAGNAVLFFTSPNLKDWQSSGSFGFGFGSTSGVWETPDLFKLPVDGGMETRWVLTVGVGDGAPAGGSGIQYFVGTFDGKSFTSENPKNVVMWADFGADFYAAQSWSDTGDRGSLGRRIWLAWMNNWRYASVIPTLTWRGSMTIPRDLRLTRTGDGIRLVQTAVLELAKLRNSNQSWQNITIAPDAPFIPEVAPNWGGETLEIIAELETPIDANSLGIRVRVGDEEATAVGYAPKSNTLFVDRSNAGQANFYDNFAKNHTTLFGPENDILKLHIFVDRSSVEVFVNDGLVSFSEQIFPSDASVGVELFAEGTAVTVRNLEIYKLNPANFYVPPGSSES